MLNNSAKSVISDYNEIFRGNINTICQKQGKEKTEKFFYLLIRNSTDPEYKSIDPALEKAFGKDFRIKLLERGQETYNVLTNYNNFIRAKEPENEEDTKLLLEDDFYKNIARLVLEQNEIDNPTEKSFKLLHQISVNFTETIRDIVTTLQDQKREPQQNNKPQEKTSLSQAKPGTAPKVREQSQRPSNNKPNFCTIS